MRRKEEKKGSGNEKQGYRCDMLAVVLVPVLVLVAACLLERLETSLAPTDTRRRPAVPDAGTSPAAPAVVEETPRRRHLQAVPALATEGPDAPVETEREWRRAS